MCCNCFLPKLRGVRLNRSTRVWWRSSPCQRGEGWNPSQLLQSTLWQRPTHLKPCCSDLFQVSSTRSSGISSRNHLRVFPWSREALEFFAVSWGGTVRPGFNIKYNIWTLFVEQKKFCGVSVHTWPATSQASKYWSVTWTDWLSAG